MAVTGHHFPLLRRQAAQTRPALSFLHPHYTDVDAWRREARDYLGFRLLYQPEACELEPELASRVEYDEYALEKWYIATAPDMRVPIMLLKPHDLDGPAPAILALHGHGGMYYFGKKQLLEDAADPAILTRFREDYYDGAALAVDLVRDGYVVAVSDAFYFGECRPDLPIPDALQAESLLAAEGSDAWIELLNRVAAHREEAAARSLLWAGASWAGVLAWDDQRTVDFLCAQPDVDGSRLGCIGFDMGGFRAVLLGALDSRVRAVCVAGWMSTAHALLDDHLDAPAWYGVVPGLRRVLDWPDVASLHAPHPLLVMQGSHDPLFPQEGFQQAAEQLRGIYAKAGAPGSLDIQLFDVGHLFSREMQRHAREFLARSLRGRDG